MPSIVPATPSGTLAQALNSANATARTVLDLRHRRDLLELERKRDARADERYKLDVARAEASASNARQLMELRLLEEQRDASKFATDQAQASAGTAFNVARGRQIGSQISALTPKGRLRTADGQLTAEGRHRLEMEAEHRLAEEAFPGLAPASQAAYLEEKRVKLHQMEVDFAFTQESQELRDAVEEDKLFEDDPEIAMKLAREIEAAQQAGRMPGDVSERIRAFRQAKETQTARVSEWEVQIENAKAFQKVVNDPVVRQKIGMAIAKAEAPSRQKNPKYSPTELIPEVFGLVQERSAEASDPSAFMEPLPSAALIPKFEKLFRQRDLEREQGGGVPQGGGGQQQAQAPPPTGIKFKSLAPPERAALIERFKGLRTFEEFLALLEETGIDLATIPKPMVEKLLGSR